MSVFLFGKPLLVEIEGGLWFIFSGDESLPRQDRGVGGWLIAQRLWVFSSDTELRSSLVGSDRKLTPHCGSFALALCFIGPLVSQTYKSHHSTPNFLPLQNHRPYIVDLQLLPTTWCLLLFS